MNSLCRTEKFCSGHVQGETAQKSVIGSAGKKYMSSDVSLIVIDPS